MRIFANNDTGFLGVSFGAESTATKILYDLAGMIYPELNGYLFYSDRQFLRQLGEAISESIDYVRYQKLDNDTKLAIRNVIANRLMVSLNNDVFQNPEEGKNIFLDELKISESFNSLLKNKAKLKSALKETQDTISKLMFKAEQRNATRSEYSRYIPTSIFSAVTGVYFDEKGLADQILKKILINKGRDGSMAIHNRRKLVTILGKVLSLCININDFSRMPDVEQAKILDKIAEELASKLDGIDTVYPSYTYDSYTYTNQRTSRCRGIAKGLQLVQTHDVKEDWYGNISDPTIHSVCFPQSLFENFNALYECIDQTPGLSSIMHASLDSSCVLDPYHGASAPPCLSDGLFEQQNPFSLPIGYQVGPQINKSCSVVQAKRLDATTQNVIQHLINIQDGFREKTQDEQRKTVIQECLDKALNATSTKDELVELIKQKHHETKAAHENQYGIMGPFIGFFRRSRTEVKLAQILEEVTKEVVTFKR